MVGLAAGIAASLVVGITLAGMALAAALLLLGGVGVLVKGLASIPAVDRVGTRVVDQAVARTRGSDVERTDASQDDGQGVPHRAPPLGDRASRATPHEGP